MAQRTVRTLTVGKCRRHVAAAASALIAPCLAGCAPWVLTLPDGSRAGHYFGYVRVVTAPEAGAGPVDVRDTLLLGLQMGESLSAGYLRERRILVPVDCRVVVLVQNRQQLEDVTRRLGLRQGQGPCAAQSLAGSLEEEPQP